MTSLEKQKAVSHIASAAGCHMQSVIDLLAVAERTCKDSDSCLLELKQAVEHAKRVSFTLMGELNKLALDAEEREV